MKSRRIAQILTKVEDIETNLQYPVTGMMVLQYLRLVSLLIDLGLKEKCHNVSLVLKKLRVLNHCYCCMMFYLHRTL